MTSPVPTAARWRWLRRAAPWVIAAATLVALLYKYPLGRVVEEMERGNGLAMIPAAVGALAAIWFTATTSDFVLLRPVFGPLRYVELLRAKAGISMLNALGMAVNHGGYALWIQRRFRCRPATAISIVLFISLGDLCAVALLASLAMLLGGDAIPVAARSTIGIAAPIVLVVTLVLLLMPSRRSQRPILAPWRSVGTTNRLLGLLARCGNVLILMMATWIAARAFGLPLPLGAVFTYLPILLVVGALPINIAGIGPVQAAWIAVFAPWGSGAQILAFQFLWHLMMMCALFLRGAPFLRSVVRDVAGDGKRGGRADDAGAPGIAGVEGP